MHRRTIRRGRGRDAQPSTIVFCLSRFRHALLLVARVAGGTDADGEGTRRAG